ncbi:hypothetical protein ACHAXR_013507 [Thalassiosira sp. AJA248-18]
MPSSRRVHQHCIGGTMLLASLLLLAAPSATLAFQTSHPHHPIAASPHRPAASSGSKIITEGNSNNQRLIVKSRRMTPSSTSSTSLYFFGMNKNNNEEKDEEETTPDESSSSNIEGKTAQISFIAKSASFLKVAFPSFLAGGVATLAVLFLPLASEYYNAFHDMTDSSSSSKLAAAGNDKNNNNPNTNNVNQPVILFETILNDLNDAYVDDVDVQKLFETGVKAMTASLDPYTEFESKLEAQQMSESVTGKYGGVGLVIRGGTNLKELAAADDADKAMNDSVEKIESSPASPSSSSLKNGEKPPSSLDSAPPVAVKDAGSIGNPKLDQKSNKVLTNDDDDDDVDVEKVERRRALKRGMEDGIRVVSAFEGYAYDAGFRVGDKLTAIDDFDIVPTTSVDEVRDHLRGDPGTPVSITFEREGVGGKVNEPQTIELERSVVRIPDVKYFGFIGDPSDGIGYVDLSGFANDAGREVRYAIRALQHGAEMAAGNTNNDGSAMAITDPTKLKGLVLDLRSNPGGLLTSAVDVATLFVPNGSDIVSAKGRGFPETLYRSQTEPILNSNTRLAVLVNEQTASAAEIVTGAVQDLDVGVVVGKGRTFGKGLVQNVQDLPYQTALKYTVAKYYTPSGRCIQSTVYEEGSSSTGENGGDKFKSKKVADKDRTVFYTAHGREVKDGGGVEVDYKVNPQKASPLEIILLNSGAYSDYAAEWSKNHELTDNFKVDDATFKDFQRFVEKRQKDGDMKLEILYDSQLKELQKKLKASKSFDSSRRGLESLRADIIKDVKKDFSTYKSEITEDLEQNILTRYLPDSMLIERGLRSDLQVAETAKMLKDGREFDKLLSRDDRSLKEKGGALKNEGQSYETTSTTKPVPTLQSRW